MTNGDVLSTLLRLSIIVTVAILLIGVVRAPMRRAVGPEAAYWLWLVIPGCLIAPTLSGLPPAGAAATVDASIPLIRAISVHAALTRNIVAIDYALTATLVWLAGATIAIAYFAHCQLALKRSLGILQVLSDGIYSSTAAQQAMLVGVWSPRIVLPRDFETRYAAGERTLILAHERAHLERRDALTNFIALALICVFWFNPLVYWARNRFRFDQEVACDAAVLRQLKVPPRRYARALAKSQLASARTIGFGWWLRHPLIERVSILKCATPSGAKRRIGYTLGIAMALSSAYAARAAQPHIPELAVDSTTRIAISMRWLLDGTEVTTFGYESSSPPLRLRSGSEFRQVARSPASGMHYSLQCIPSVFAAPGSMRGPTDWKPRMILVDCEISREGKVVGTPKVVMRNGQPGKLEIIDPANMISYEIELTASIVAESTKPE